MSVRRSPSPPPLETNISFTSNSCSSVLKMIKCDYTWTIQNYSFYQDTTVEILKSSIFTAGTNDELKWQLHLYNNGDEKENSGQLSIFLRLTDCNREKIKVMFVFSIIDSEGNKTNSTASEVREFKKDKDHWGSFGWKKFISVESLTKETDRFFPDDKLTIFCEITVFEETVNVCAKSKNIPFNVPSCSLPEDMETALDNRKLSDIMFVVDDEKLYAHKIILSARSRVFSEIFKREKLDDRVKLIDVDHVDKNVFAEMLRYIYTGKSPNLAKMAGELLPAADYYELGTLKIMCEKQLCENLAIENAADVLIMADRHGAKSLMIQAQNFILKHFEKVKNTGGFQKMAQSNSDVLIEIMSTLAKKFNGNMS